MPLTQRGREMLERISRDDLYEAAEVACQILECVTDGGDWSGNATNWLNKYGHLFKAPK